MTKSKAINILLEHDNNYIYTKQYMDEYNEALGMAIKALEQEPSETPTRMKGMWIKGITKEKYDYYFGDRVKVANYECSICGRVIPDIGVDGDGFVNKLSEFPYCHCGAEMENGK